MGRVARSSRPENRARLRALCHAYGIPLAEAARILGRKDNTIHRWMTEGQEGIPPPPDEMVELLEFRLMKRYGKPKSQTRGAEETA